MEKFLVGNNGALKGSVAISGSKNAALPILAACLLTKETCLIRNVPPLSDVSTMAVILRNIGAIISQDDINETMEISASQLERLEGNYDTAGRMRASFLIMGPLLARCGQARIPLPGGCPIGSRPVDLHLKGFALMGAKIIKEHGYVEITAKNLRGNKIYLDFPSVGATENIMMAATLAAGVTIIENAAAEPEVCDLAVFLRNMGADIKGEGSDTIIIKGQKELHGSEHEVIFDRIEAGTFMVASAITGGDIYLENVREEQMKPIIAKLSESNVKIEVTKAGLHVYRKGKLQPIQLKTMPFPGFPTDLQAPFMSLLAMVRGTSMITETVFENRFQHAGELKRMGADIKIDSRCAVIEGVDKLMGTQVRATDLRAGAALVLSALAAEGMTEISDIYHIERGYSHIEEKLRSLGGSIKKVDESSANELNNN